MFKQELEVNVKLQVELQVNTTFDEFTVFANCTTEKGMHTVCFSNTKKCIYNRRFLLIYNTYITFRISSNCIKLISFERIIFRLLERLYIA